MWPFTSSYPKVALEDLREKYDYIIVGGGTAGCVLANRLSASADKTVLLIERGPIADDWASRVPLLSSDFSSDGSRSQKRSSEYQPAAGRKFEFVNGSALGGSSRINQMLYARGAKAEYDLWASIGCEGWGCVIKSCQNLGLPYLRDINSPKEPLIGCGRLNFTRDENEYRNSTYHAFLPHKLVSQRSNLHVLTNAVAEKLLVDVGGGNPFVEGVQISSRFTSHRKTVVCNQEVILCAGPFGSPQILMLSGIGPAEHLKEHKIQVHKNLPAVGENLQDHFAVSIAHRVPMSHSLVSLEKRPWVFLIELFKWLVWGTGMLLAPVLQLAIFASSSSLDHSGRPLQKNDLDSDELPDIEIMPMAYDSSDFDFDKSCGVFSFLCVLLSPKSKGNLRLTSATPEAPLKVDPKYLSNPEDYGPLRASLKLALRISEDMRASGYPIEDWKTEMPQGEDDASLDKFIRWRNRSTYHYSSTCRMGPREDSPDGGAVVDEQLRVFGVDGLRIADSSVFPWILGTHLQAPAVMVAEKCAHMILHSKTE
ncbi:L-sorbose 1-dehydrogenase [Leucoagaricus sp. SymC.cos]|nr:L-sorbose 1-dehydrogenase [Leucoagaricus sp. SymC.cos]